MYSIFVLKLEHSLHSYSHRQRLRPRKNQPGCRIVQAAHRRLECVNEREDMGQEVMLGEGGGGRGGVWVMGVICTVFPHTIPLPLKRWTLYQT
jgi:hypothetical protein